MITAPETSRLFGIRETSEEAGLSIDTLRWYEREGMIPGVTRDTVGHRLYSPTTRGFIQLIAALRRTGMPVAEVRAFVSLGPGTTANHRPRLEILRHQLEQIELHQQQLNKDRAAITAKIAQYRSLIASGLDCEDEIADFATNP